MDTELTRARLSLVPPIPEVSIDSPTAQRLVVTATLIKTCLCTLVSRSSVGVTAEAQARPDQADADSPTASA